LAGDPALETGLKFPGVEMPLSGYSILSAGSDEIARRRNRQVENCANMGCKALHLLPGSNPPAKQITFIIAAQEQLPIGAEG
jgi:hypothetical protein